jgi:hypothetical protein
MSLGFRGKRFSKADCMHHNLVFAGISVQPSAVEGVINVSIATRVFLFAGSL